MLELTRQTPALRKPRNSIAIPFLFRKAKKIWKPIDNIFRLIELGKISGGLLHDIMGPVTALTLYVSSLEKNSPHAEAVIESSKRIEEMINLIRKQLSETSAVKPFSVIETIKNANELLRYKAIRNGVRLVMINNEEDVRIFGKELLFYQIIVNLISNAIDSYESCNEINESRKDVIVKVECFEKNINISIRDFGCGIDRKNQNKIFKYFYSNKPNGTGIGLSVIYQIIEKEFGGNIKFSSEINKGSTFVVSIPRNSLQY